MLADIPLKWMVLSWGSGLLVTATLTPLVRSWAIRHQLLDQAGQFHTTHTVAIPRLGGLSLILAFIAILIGILSFATHENFTMPDGIGTLCFGCLAIFAIGFLDDLNPLGARVKLAAQILVSWLVYLGGLRIGQWENPLTHTIYTLGAWDAPLTILWLVSITNLINLVDGVDGLAAGVTLFLMILLSVVSMMAGNFFLMFISLGMAGALLGFLFYNFPPAKIFMGDGGAYFLGMLIAELALVNSNKGEVAAALIVPFLAMGLPIIDASFTIFRRGLLGLPLFRADRKHIHHRLTAMGFSRQRTVLLLYVVCTFFALLALAFFVRQGRLLPILFGVFMIVTILSAKIFGFVQSWYKLGRSLTDSVHRRKHTKYALLLSDLLIMESERSTSLDDLWNRFGLMLQKLDFCKVTWTSGSEEKQWKSESTSKEQERFVCHELKEKKSSSITLFCKWNVWDEDTFHLLSELTAEAWLKALTKWKRSHGISS